MKNFLHFADQKHPIILFLFVIVIIHFVSPNKILSSTLEERIRSGEVSTLDLVVPYHPRIWMRGEKDWDKSLTGSFAWRIVHGGAMKKHEPANDQEKYEFYYSCCGIDYGADYMFGQTRGTYRQRVLEPIMAAKSLKLNWGNYLPDKLPDYSATYYKPQHSIDEYFSDARSKLLWLITRGMRNYGIYTITYGSVAYDWLINERYTNGTPVLSEDDKKTIQQTLIANADYFKGQAGGKGQFFKSGNIAVYMYPIVGFALYERLREGDPSYAYVNAKAREYLNDFDLYWIGKILPAFNEQGGDGGWHGGLTKMHIPWIINENSDLLYNIPEIIAPFLYSHCTATDFSIDESVFSTGVIKYFAEFQNYMLRPGDPGRQNGIYYDISGEEGEQTRGTWVFPMRTYTRRRFSFDGEQLRLAELGAWIRSTYQLRYTGPGSWDNLDQLLFEDKWVNPRNPKELGCGSKHFQKLGWVFMRTGFGSANDLAAFFICQRYHWSHLDPYAQNSFNLEYKGELIQGFNNTLLIGGQEQRRISNFPTISQGVGAYSQGSVYDVGPGITDFESNGQYDYMYGDAANAYDTNMLEKFTRQIVYLKPDKFIIFDYVVTKDKSFKKSWMIDPGAAPQSISSNFVSIKNGSGALWLKRLWPRDIIIENQSSEKYQFTPLQSNRKDIFLHVLQTTESTLSVNSPGVVVDDVSLFSKDGRIGVSFDGWEVLFKADGSAGVQISRSGSSSNISGRVRYFSSNNGVQNSFLNLTGGMVDAETTDELGYYQFAGLAENLNYTITPQKTGDILSNTITSYDAALTAQMAFDVFPNITDEHRKAADVTKNGSIQMYDAAMIARYAVGLDPLPETCVGDWAFMPEFRTYLALNSSADDANFTAIVLGDVSGNWSSPPNFAGNDLITGNANFQLEARKENGNIIIPFISNSQQEIYSYDIIMNFDPTILRYEQIINTASKKKFKM